MTKSSFNKLPLSDITEVLQKHLKEIINLLEYFFVCFKICVVIIVSFSLKIEIILYDFLIKLLVASVTDVMFDYLRLQFHDFFFLQSQLKTHEIKKNKVEKGRA